MDITQATQDVYNFLLEAGNYAKEKQSSVKKFLKAGEQALTEADLKISEMAKERFSPWFEDGTHALIDEESIKKTPTEIFSNTEYQWVLDPIDGTAGYALGRRLWGVSLGVLHRGEPLLGGIYIPFFGEILISDGQKSERIEVLSGKRTTIKAEYIEINSQVFIESISTTNKEMCQGVRNLAWLNTPESAVQGFYSALTNQAAGAESSRVFSLWDSAGSFAVAKYSGHKIYDIESKQEFERFDASMLEENWKIKNRLVMTHPKNLEKITSIFRKLGANADESEIKVA